MPDPTKHGPESLAARRIAAQFSHSPMRPTTLDDVLVAVETLQSEVRTLREKLDPPSAVILTGAEVQRYYDQLRSGTS